jgi:HAE1 family hydrophobic/amphiphilic exporter-1
VVAYRQGSPIYLKDVARIEDGLEDPRKLARYNGSPAVGLGVVKTSGANTVAVVDAVKQRVEKEVIPALPPGLSIRYSTDDSVSIRQSIEALQEHLLLGTLFAAIMVFVFLKSGRSTLIVATAIPVSLLATFAVCTSPTAPEQGYRSGLLLIGGRRRRHRGARKLSAIARRIATSGEAAIRHSDQ